MKKFIMSSLVIAGAALFTLVGMEKVGSSRAVRQVPPEPTQAKRYKATKPIFIDRQTGQLRLPTEQETQELVTTLAAKLNTSTKGLQSRQLANGAQVMELAGRFGSLALTRTDADGSTESRCVSSFAEAAAFLGLEEVNE